MLEQYKTMRDEIRWYENEEEEIIGIAKCKEYLKIVQKNKTDDTKDDMHFGYFVMAKLHKKHYGCKNLNKTIQYIKQSIKYSVENKNNYMSSIWLLADCYAKSCNIKKSMNTYNICKEYYKRIGFKEYELYVHFNMAKLLECTYMMEKLVDSYLNDFKYNEDLLNEMYTDIFDIYIETNKMKAIGLLHKIPNKTLTRELSKKLRVA